MTGEPDPRLVALGLVPAAPIEPIEKKKEEPRPEVAKPPAAAAPPPQPPVPDQLFRGMGKFTGMPAAPAPSAAPPSPPPGHDLPPSALPPGFVAPSPSRSAPPPLYTPPPRPAQPARTTPPVFAPAAPEAPLREAPPPLPPLAAVTPAPPVAQPPRTRVRRGRPARAAKLGVTAAPKPLAPPRPPLPPSPVLLKGPIVMGFPEKEHELSLEQLGFRIDAEEPIEIAWTEVREIKARRGRVVVRTKGKPVTFTISVDGVGEPTLAAPLARVVKESSGGTLDIAGSAVLELQNASDTLRDRFHDEDDPVIPTLVGLIFVFAGFVLTGILPDALAIAARMPYAPGAFLIDSPLASFDPRILLVSFAAAAALAAGVVRVAMGKAAMAWALGTLRGWHEGSRPAVDTGRRLLALIVLYPAVAAAVVLGAIFLAVPSLRVQTVIDGGGVHLVRPLPFFDDDRPWEAVTDITTVPAPTYQHFEGVAVIIHFEDGSTLSTLDGRLRGGTDKQLLASATAWLEGPP